ncbi:MAG TPA: twin-arginine translocation pathway signal [Modicisalibacter sp.]|nr:twin-arginine translocation pathway signal [Modicisalibacter sp.]
MGKTSSTATNPQRRRFLRTLGLGTAAAGAAASIGHVTFVQADQSTDAVATDPDTHYRETDHVRAFYATLRD